MNSVIIPIMSQVRGVTSRMPEWAVQKILSPENGDKTWQNCQEKLLFQTIQINQNTQQIKEYDLLLFTTFHVVKSL